MAVKSSKKKSGSLGRGLGNLLDAVENEKGTSKNSEGIVKIDLDKIKPNPDNPRKKFDQTAIAELASTIKEYGLLQPILVRSVNDKYFVISGERRLRACRLLKIKQIPVIIKEVENKENIEISLIENIQREQLDPIEEGEVYSKLIG
ncbi:MAG: ParB/RepB/Spo0J family partition protein, partial [Leptospirales bacterium]